jgi:hypothetical protein
MPSFIVKIHKTVEWDGDITVTAKDEDTAQTKAEALLNNPKALDKIEWELDDENYEVTEVDEEEI